MNNKSQLIIYEDNSCRASFDSSCIFHNEIKSSIDARIASSLHYECDPTDHVQQVEFHDDSEPADLKMTRVMNGENSSLLVDFRLLSKAIIYQNSWFGLTAMDFSNGNVLKSSRHKLVGRTVLPDHTHSTKEWLGTIEKVEWTESINNIHVEGIDGTLYLDIDPDPKHPTRRTIRGVEKGAISSFSVSVWFDYKRSHPKMDIYDFLRRMGTKDENGEIIRLIVTKIRRYYEGSLVVAGADPLARRRKLSTSVQAENEFSLKNTGVLGAFSLDSGWTFKDGVCVMAKTKKDPSKEISTETEKISEAETSMTSEQQVSLEEMSDTDSSKSNSELIKTQAETLSKLHNAIENNKALQSNMDEVHKQLTEVSKEKDELLQQLDSKSSELSKCLESIEMLKAEFASYKEEVQPRLDFADVSEEKFRKMAVDAYNKYTLTFTKQLPEKTKEQRINAILNTMPMNEVFSSSDMWTEEFNSRVEPGKKSTDLLTKQQRSSYEGLTVVDDALVA